MIDTVFYKMFLPGCAFDLTNQEKSIDYSTEESEIDDGKYWGHPDDHKRGAFDIFDNFDDKN